MREERTKVREAFLRAIQQDPFLVGTIWNIITEGVDTLTDFGTIILVYENKKTGINFVLDPAKPDLFIKNEKTGEQFNINIQQAIKLTKETYGTPQTTEIPKFGTNIPEAQNFLDKLAQGALFRNFPPHHHKHQDPPENQTPKEQGQEDNPRRTPKNNA